MGEVEEPPWVAPKFDVKKKPPHVPKPRYVTARPTSAVTVVDETGDDAGSLPPASLPLARPRWGQLGEGPHHTFSEAIPVQVLSGLGAIPASEASGPISVGSNVPKQLLSPSERSPVIVKPTPHDHQSTWQRWRAIPGGVPPSLEEKMQQLMRPPPQPSQRTQAPSKEALEFLESLLSGTEPSAASASKRCPIVGGPAKSTAQIVDNAQRLRAQAEAARQKRFGSGDPTAFLASPACAKRAGTSPRATHNAQRQPHAENATTEQMSEALSQDRGLRTDAPRKGPAAGGDGQASGIAVSQAAGPAAQCSIRGARGADRNANGQQQSKAPNPSEAGRTAIPVDDFEQRMREKEDEHKRRLRELEEQTAREQQQMLREMEHEQAEIAARRRAQDEWKEDLVHKTERLKQEAEQKARQRNQSQARSEEAWRNCWWRNWQRSEERAHRKMDEQKEWSKQWWEQWRAKEEEEDFEFAEDEPSWHAGKPQPSPREGRGPAPAPPPPPPPRAASRGQSLEQAQVLEQLVMYRREPLEERKRTWRQMCLQWHPDKCGDKAGATVMFQYLQGLKEWFLAEK